MMTFSETSLVDALIIQVVKHGDSRGYFMESFRALEFEQATGVKRFKQENYSQSQRGTLRGLHYQTNNVQGKLVQVLTGDVFDVIVDLRQSSATYGQYHSVILSSDNAKQLWVPEGFAHGFCVLSDCALMSYKCTDYYDPKSEQVILYNDADLNIDWPLSDKISLSDKDKNGLSFSSAPKFK